MPKDWHLGLAKVIPKPMDFVKVRRKERQKDLLMVK